MLLVGVLGPQGVLPVVISSTIASYVLGNITYFWFRSSAKSLTDASTKSGYFTLMQPCSVAFINYWKAASYTAAVLSAVVVAIAHELDSEEFPISLLTYVLLGTWAFIIVAFSSAYFFFRKETSSRSKLLDDLISYPFFWRDLKEEMAVQVGRSQLGKPLEGGGGSLAVLEDEAPNGTSECLWFLHPTIAADKRSIPGYRVSPWHDSLDTLSTGGYSPRNPMSAPPAQPVSVETYKYADCKSSFSSVLMRRKMVNCE
jgi:hypothetical protein